MMLEREKGLQLAVKGCNIYSTVAVKIGQKCLYTSALSLVHYVDQIFLRQTLCYLLRYLKTY